MEIDRHFIAEKVNGGIVNLTHVPTEEQLADVFTKALSKPVFDKFLSKLGLYNVYAPTWGECEYVTIM